MTSHKYGKYIQIFLKCISVKKSVIQNVQTTLRIQQGKHPNIKIVKDLNKELIKEYPRVANKSGKKMFNIISLSSVQFSRSVVSDSLRPHESQHARPPCPSPTPEFTQIHVHRVSDAIQPSHPLSSPSPPAPNPSQHQNLFQ